MSATLPAPAEVRDGRVEVDVAIVGAGVAGLYAAACLPDDLRVLVIDKGVPGGDSGSSPWAQGGLAAAIAPEDSVAAHVEDTVRAGDGLCDPLAVRTLAREAPAHVARLLELGADLDRLPGHLGSRDLAHLSLAREGGQRVARSVRRADATGAELMRVLRAAAAPRVQRLAATVDRALHDVDGAVTGLRCVTADGPVEVRAGAVVLATGGCGGLYAATTNPDGATGDGIAVAAGAGAAVRDLEFVQFHPTGLAVGGTWRFLLTEALRGAGATLHTAEGRRFLVGRHPDAELAPRHVVAKATLELPEGRAWLDASHLGEATLVAEFPTVLAGARQHGFDLASERVPVTPAAHYQVGGVRTDLDGRTSVPRLYACGEVASTGVHGANRMASNSLAEALVFGARTARAVAAELADSTGTAETAGPLPTGPSPHAAELTAWRRELRDTMLRDAGPVRDAAGLSRVAGLLEQRLLVLEGVAPSSPAVVELRHAHRTAALLVRAATLRAESRGGHWREDHPAPDPSMAGVHLEVTPGTPAG